MKEFHFRLQSVLDIRSYKEQEAEMDLGRANGKVVSIEGEIHGRRAVLTGKGKESTLPRGTDVLSELAVRDIYRTRLAVEIDDLKERLEDAKKQRQKYQEAYVEASRDRKVLDSLKERRAVDYYKEQRKEEVKETDDLNNAAYARKQLGNVFPMSLIQGLDPGERNFEEQAMQRRDI